MRSTTMRAAIDFNAARGALVSIVSLVALAAASLPCSAADRLVDVTTLPRLEGAMVDPAHSASDDVSYSVPGSVANTVAATRKLLAADGWKPYVSPSAEPDATGLDFKKGSQGLIVSFTMTGGQTDQSSVYYNPDRLIVDLPLPDDASDIVFDARRPYLNCVTGATIEATLAFFAKALPASGWSPLAAAGAAAHWPSANLDDGAANGPHAYYINEDQRPIMLALQTGADGKTRVEVKIPPFAEPQFLEAGPNTSELPVPKRAISSRGSSSDIQSKLEALVPAEVGTVLAFYRREFESRNFKEETKGAVINPDDASLTFSSAEGTAMLRLSHKYDLTTINLVVRVSDAVLAARAKAKKDADDKFAKDAQDMVDAALAASNAKRAASAKASDGPTQTLSALAGAKAPVPIPDTAEDLDYDAANGKLEFNSASSFKAVVAFYRSAMKPLGWKPQPSVINSPNMVELDFSKGGKEVSFTIMQMGDAVNVTADGSALVSAEGSQAAGDTDAKSASAAAPASAPGSDQDLEAEESGGLPVPKQHTLSDGAQTPFRRGVTASVPANLTAVLAFYRRELTKLNWTEDTKTAAVATDDRAVVAFTSPDGPAVLKLGRKNGETSVDLAVRNPQAAAQAGIMPKAGQAKLLFGNALPADAAITINNKTVKVSGGVGTQGPDGPSLDLAPGKYPYSIKMPGGPSQRDNVEIGADETWGLLIGPGGALPLRMY
jgi:hypothetical protein